MLLMALNALWPLIAAARPADSAMMEICTAQGLRLVAGEPSAPQNGSGAKDPMSHCTLCAGSDKPAAPPSAHEKIPVAAARVLLPVQGQLVLASRGHGRSPAQPRAPPAIS